MTRHLSLVFAAFGTQSPHTTYQEQVLSSPASEGSRRCAREVPAINLAE
jgi:hypothetical protein